MAAPDPDKEGIWCHRSLTQVSGLYTSLVLHAVKAYVGVIDGATAYLGVIFCTRELQSEDEGMQAFLVSHAMTNVQDFSTHETTTSITRHASLNGAPSHIRGT